MSDDMIKYAQQLRRLIDDYYHQQLSPGDYRAQRKDIFDRIEKELAGGNVGSDPGRVVSLDESTSHT
jgi:hypothetical protein